MQASQKSRLLSAAAQSPPANFRPPSAAAAGAQPPAPVAAYSPVRHHHGTAILLSTSVTSTFMATSSSNSSSSHSSSLAMSIEQLPLQDSASSSVSDERSGVRTDTTTASESPVASSGKVTAGGVDGTGDGPGLVITANWCVLLSMERGGMAQRESEGHLEDAAF